MQRNPAESVNQTQPLSQMIEALALEIAAIKKSGGSTTVELFGGALVSESNGSYIYRFPVLEDLQLRDDTPVRIKFGQQEVDGSIVSLGEGVIVLALEENVGAHLPHVRLIADESFLVERLRARLQQVQSGEVRFNLEAASRVIGASPINSERAELPAEVVEGEPFLNSEQLDAISLSLGGNTTFVWGPPGTGKTTALARIVESHFRVGRSVLLVSNTNIAVDTALEKIAERLQTEPSFQAGAVLRFGPVVKEELKQNFGEQVVLDNVVARLSHSLRQDLSAAQAESLSLSQTAQQLRKVIADYQQVANVTSDLTREREVEKTHREKFHRLATELQAQTSALELLKGDLEKARNMGAVSRFFRGLNPEKLQQRIANTEVQRKAISDAQVATAASHEAAGKTIKRLEVHLTELSSRVQALPDLGQSKSRLASAESRAKALDQKIADLQKQIEQIRQDVLSRCRVLATTIYRTYLKGQVDRQFDVVVIDEASMLMLPMSFYAAGIALGSVTVAGDFRQLPPIVKSDEQLALDWLKQDVFYKAGIPKQVASNSSPMYLSALRVQYRMQEPICDITNELFYPDHNLLTDSSVPLREEMAFPFGGNPLLYVDTASLHPWAALNLGTYSRYNLLHALLIKKMALHCADAGYLHAENKDALGIVAPYSAQTRLMQALIEDALGPSSRHYAATVHRFQGNEKQAMIVDLTDSTGCRLGRFMKGVACEDDGTRLLNVAISRARDHVVLVANFEYLRAHASSNTIVRRLLDIFEERGTAITLDTVLPIGDEEWIEGLHKIIPTNIELRNDQWGAFSEATFYSAFARDLESAQSSILILSPFLTSRGTSRWAGHFQAALRRGVQVRIVTRPSAEFGGASEDEVAETIDKLRELRIAVDLRGRMHEKVAVIDEGIAWHGSLNILSHRDTSESMLRLTGAAACRCLLDLFSPPISRRDEARTASKAENPPCGECGTPTVLYDGRYGIYFECPHCGAKVDPRRQSPKRKEQKPSTMTKKKTLARGKPDVSRSCPRAGCNGRLVQRNGPRGPFLGCSNFPRCRETQNV